MKITFDIGRQQIGIDGDAPELLELLTLVREIAPKLPSITIETTGNRSDAQRHTSNGALVVPAVASDATAPANRTMRQFVRSLSLGSMAEKIAAIGYYQKHVLSRDTFSPKEMGDWFIQCGLQKPAQMPVAVFDAKKKSGLVDNAGHGVWKLSTQGENLVIRKMEESGEVPQ